MQEAIFASPASRPPRRKAVTQNVTQNGFYTQLRGFTRVQTGKEPALMDTCGLCHCSLVPSSTGVSHGPVVLKLQASREPNFRCPKRMPRGLPDIPRHPLPTVACGLLCLSSTTVSFSVSPTLVSYPVQWLPWSSVKSLRSGSFTLGFCVLDSVREGHQRYYGVGKGAALLLQLGLKSLDLSSWSDVLT